MLHSHAHDLTGCQSMPNSKLSKKNDDHGSHEYCRRRWIWYWSVVSKASTYVQLLLLLA